MNKYKILILLIAASLIFNLGINDYSASSTTRLNPEKGDLACPLNDKGQCKEEIGSNGKVISTTISYKTQDGVTVYKKVSKTNIPGEYTVNFYVDSSVEIQIKDEAYAVLVIDASRTVCDSFDAIKNASDNFSGKLEEKGINSAIIQFATNSKIVKNFGVQTTSYAKVNTGSKCKTSSSGYDLGIYSNAYTGINSAKSLLSNKSGKKYIVLIGDGEYYCNGTPIGKKFSCGSTSPTNNKKAFDDIQGSANKLYMIKYNSKYPDRESTNQTYINTYIKPTNLFDKSEGSYDDLLNRIFSDIDGDVGSLIGNTVTITDTLGGSFTLVDTSSKLKFNLQDKQSYSFNIKIDPKSKNGWHETNSNFTIKYLDSKTQEKSYTVNINPEVYWEKENVKIESCTGKSTVSVNDVLEKTDYYSISCREKYNVNIKINNLGQGVKEFKIHKWDGFPSELALDTKVECILTFNNTKFENKYKELNDEYKKAKTDREKVSVKQKINNLISVIESYKNIKVENLVKEYETRFTKQAANMNVKLSNGKNESLEYVDIGTSNTNISKTYENRVNVTIDSKKYNVIKNTTIIGTFNKKMQLKEQKLDAISGQVSTKCNENNCITGGNNLYIDIGTVVGTKGYVDVIIDNITIFGNEKIELKNITSDPSCSFDVIDNNILYREIDIQDPFISRDTNRKTGDNWSNAISSNGTYNFKNIIRSNIWDNDVNPLYNFKLARKDIGNIIKETRADNEAYRIDDCVISNNKLVCKFVSKYLEVNK